MRTFEKDTRTKAIADLKRGRHLDLPGVRRRPA